MIDYIIIKDLAVSCVIGTWDWEQASKQRLLFSLSLGVDTSSAAASDDLHDAVNYQRVCERVVEIAQAKPRQLLEALVDEIAKELLEEFDIQELTIEVDKGPAVANAKSVGLRIHRQKSAN